MYLPAAQLVQVFAVANAAVNLPTGHPVQAAATAAENVPGEHSAQDSEPGTLNRPAVQFRHADCPVAALYLPAVQFVQAAAPERENMRAGQSMHALEFAELY